MKAHHTLSRQQFLQTTAAALGAASLSAEALAQEAANPIRIGIVGTGSRGIHLMTTLLGMPSIEVPAVCDIIPDHAARAQQVVEDKTGKRPEAYTQGERDFERLCARDDLDAVINATPWNWHTPVAVAAMRAGKYAGVEVPAAITLDECWDLVRTSEETGKPCMMLENVCYFENALTLLRMVREGLFGEVLHCAGGYQHDCRFLLVNKDGTLTWRGEFAAKCNGNLYPTHPIGPIAQWMNVNRGDRFASLVSMSTPSLGINAYAAEILGPDHPLAKRSYALGDVNTTLIKTANGKTITLYFDMSTPRAYDLMFRLQGAKGIYNGTADQIYLDGQSPEKDKNEPFAPYMQKYAHPLWTGLEQKAKESGGHGGADYITLYEFVKAVRNQTPPPQDVYDAAAWSAIFPLTIQSVANNNAQVDFPDFTSGKWKTTAPVPVYGA